MSLEKDDQRTFFLSKEEKDADAVVEAGAESEESPESPKTAFNLRKLLSRLAGRKSPEAGGDLTRG